MDKELDEIIDKVEAFCKKYDVGLRINTFRYTSPGQKMEVRVNVKKER